MLGLHVARLGSARPARDEHRRIELFTDKRLVWGSEVIAPFQLLAAFLQELKRFVIRQPWVRTGSCALEPGSVAFKDGELITAALQNAAHQAGDELFLQVQALFERLEGDLGYEHPEFQQVTAGLAA